MQKNLSGTISRLKLLRGLQAQAPAAAPSGRLLELTGFGANPGALQGWFYLPDGLRRTAPLVVVLHGCTQTSAGYDWGSGWSELADQEGFALLFPEQQRSNNANLCFNWFQPSDTRRDAGEALSIREMIETMLTAHGLDRGRVFITGLSAGGAMAAAVLAAYPETFAAGAIIAGLPVGVAHTVPEAFERMRGNGLPSPEKLQELLRQASPHRGPWPGSRSGTARSTASLPRPTPERSSTSGLPFTACRQSRTAGPRQAATSVSSGAMAAAAS